LVCCETQPDDAGEKEGGEKRRGANKGETYNKKEREKKGGVGEMGGLGDSTLKEPPLKKMLMGINCLPLI
jgi:hypothetical protein